MMMPVLLAFGLWAGSGAIKGITLNVSEVEEMCLSPQVFRSMPNLMFLNFYKNYNNQVGNKLKLPNGLEFLPNKIRLLGWVGYPLKSLPTTFKVENLVQIEMNFSKLTKLWDGDQNLVSLKKIELHGPKKLIELPNFSKAKHLAEVNLDYCSKLRELFEVPDNIGLLSSIRELHLSETNIETLPLSTRHLSRLQELYLDRCKRLRSLPELPPSLPLDTVRQ
ncbi:disease resistance protein ADR2-like [Neltuma alba]|uniref:disease resistance protein ADR2-like n=1 Tax=Neltuma alba TaxID=207710 RepID=UPI0010A40368|nr:disease resistance protein ADR2-like [Prosopis alba]